MTSSFKPAVLENAQLLIGLAGPTGGGKTYSAMRLATGIAAECGKPFAVIDTENGRAKHYAGRFNFDYAEINAPFRPDAYLDKIIEADKAGYSAIVIDSISHEQAGEGGLNDWHEEELIRMAGSDYQKREACKMAAWIKPKMAHKKFMMRILQVKAHLIFCLRAENRVEMVKVLENGKQVTKIIDKGFQPICEKSFMYEMVASFLLLPEKEGIPRKVKLQDQHKAIFPDGAQIDEECGRRLARWAKGNGAALEKGLPVNNLIEGLQSRMYEAASQGTKEFLSRWDKLAPHYKTDLEAVKEECLAIAKKADGAS